MRKTKGLTTEQVRASEARARASVGRRTTKAYKDYFQDKDDDEEFFRKRINKRRIK